MPTAKGCFSALLTIVARLCYLIGGFYLYLEAWEGVEDKRYSYGVLAIIFFIFWLHSEMEVKVKELKSKLDEISGELRK